MAEPVNGNSFELFRFKRVFFYVVVFAVRDFQKFLLFEMFCFPFIGVVKDNRPVVEQDHAVYERVEKLVFFFVVLIFFVREII